MEEKVAQIYRQLVYDCTGSEPPHPTSWEREGKVTDGRRYTSVKEAAFCLQTTKKVLHSILNPFAMGKSYPGLNIDEVRQLYDLINEQERVFTRQLTKPEA